MSCLSMKKLMGYVHQAVGDLGAILCAALINIGDKLNLFQAMAGSRSDDAGRVGPRDPHHRALRA